MNRANGEHALDAARDLDVVACSWANVMVTARDAADRAMWAQTIHDRSAGSDRPLVTARREATATDDGPESVDRWFRQAAGGTLFIDRIDGLDSLAQDRLLTRLDEQSHRHGATSAGDGQRVRIISGSTRSLLADLEVGAFSDILFYRLNVIHIDLTHQDEYDQGASSCP